MASEDSDQFLSGFLAVHGSDDFNNRRQTFTTEVLLPIHHLDTRRELLEVAMLRRAQRVSTEERNHNGEQIRSPTNHISMQQFPVIVVATIDQDHANTEEGLELIKTPDALGTLGHDKLVEHLIPSSVADSAITVRLTHQAEGEASFSIYKAQNPTQRDQPFLLIVRTLHIVTEANVTHISHSSEGSSDVPAYSQILLRQRFHLRTVHSCCDSNDWSGWIAYQLLRSPARSDYLIPSCEGFGV
jgi:hypothetical protein